MTEKERLLIDKINKLAKEGIGGEKINAQKKLQELMTKYGITEADLESQEKRVYYYKLPKTEVLIRLFKQVVWSFNPEIRSTEIRYNKIGLELTSEEHIELKARLDFYFEHFKEELETLFIAFVHKHRIFPPESDDEENNESKEEMSPEKIAKIVKMMSNMDDVEYKKLIENN